MNINELIRLADLLDESGEHAAAEEVDKLIRDNSADQNNIDLQIEKPSQDELKVAFDKFVASPEQFENVNRLKEMIDDYIVEKAPGDITNEEPIKQVDQNIHPQANMTGGEVVASFKDVFEKLAKVADSLDIEGAKEEANMIDSFLAKHADDISVIDPDTLEDPKLDLPDVKDEDPTEEDHEEEGDGLGPAAEEEMEKLMKELEELEGKRAELINKLTKSADYSEDRVGEGDTEQSKRYDEKHHHDLLVREPKGDKERVDREGRKEHHIENYNGTRMSLSTRHCPEHIGSQMGRVGQGVYQCPIDGAVFNWDIGFETFDGNHYDGGSVAGQTPNSTGYAIPNKIFDSRDKVLNVIN